MPDPDYPTFLGEYVVVPKTNEYGGDPENEVESISLDPAEEEKTADFFPGETVGQPTFDRPIPVEEIPTFTDVEIPEGAVLLSTDAGDLHYRPSGMANEQDFLVLFFDNPDSLFFVPKTGTRFTCAFDGTDKREIYKLFYSGIKFMIEESNRLVMIFHKVEALV